MVRASWVIREPMGNRDQVSLGWPGLARVFMPDHEPEFEDQRHTTASVPRIIKGFFA
jgi:hypothetical protein